LKFYEKNKFAMITTENAVVVISPPASPTICPFSLNILLFKENLSELLAWKMDT